MSAEDIDRLDVTAWRGHRASRVESHAARVYDCALMATITRTRDVIQFDIERAGEAVTLLVTAEALELRLPTIEWPHPHEPVASTRLWKRVLWSSLDDGEAPLRELVDAAFERRRSEFVRCRFCKEPTPPERRHGRVCHGCAERHLRVVH